MKILDELTEKLTMLKGITFSSAGFGTLGSYVSKITIETDLLTLFAYGSYVISMTVGVLTVITWFRKNRKDRRIPRDKSNLK